MNKLSKSAFIAAMALISYTGFAAAQVVSFDKPSDLSNLVNDLKFGGPGGPGGHGGPGGPGGPGGGQPHVNPPTPVHNPGGDHGGFNGGDHNGPGNHGGFNPGGDHGGFNPGGDHGGFNPGGDHGGFGPGGDHNGPGHDDHGGFGPGHQPDPWHPGPQPDPWHPQPNPWNPQPTPWHPGPQPGPGGWQPHHDGHPDWDHNNWGNNHWNHHDIGQNDWWNNYDYYWTASSHPFSLYRTICNVLPGNSAKGFIVEESMPFNGTATFYYYNAYNTLLGSGIPATGSFRGGDGTPIMNYYQMAFPVDHCFMAITQ